MSQDMARVTLEMLHRLEDFENACLKADSELREKAPESSRGLTTAQSKRIELGNIKGCIHALRNSIRIYRGSGQQAKAG